MPVHPPPPHALPTGGSRGGRGGEHIYIYINTHTHTHEMTDISAEVYWLLATPPPIEYPRTGFGAAWHFGHSFANCNLFLSNVSSQVMRRSQTREPQQPLFISFVLLEDLLPRRMCQETSKPRPVNLEQSKHSPLAVGLQQRDLCLVIFFSSTHNSGDSRPALT